MPATKVIATDHPELAPFLMPERFRTEIVYFMTPGDHHGAPTLGPHEYWIRAEDVATWLEDGIFTVVSPLDAETVAEIELTEEQEKWLEWMSQNGVTKVRVEA